MKHLATSFTWKAEDNAQILEPRTQLNTSRYEMHHQKFTLLETFRPEQKGYPIKKLHMQNIQILEPSKGIS